MSDQQGLYLGGFLWAPSEKFWPNIIRNISSKYQITYIRKYKFHSHDDLRRMIVKLYKNDNVSMRKVEKYKISALENYPPTCLHFQLYISDPNLIRKKHDIIEPNVIAMKRSIRKKYKGRIVGYSKDIIIHISDNKKQTSFIDNIINKSLTYD